MKVSVIVRAFNEEKHLDKLFRGIFAQKTDFETEVILVDSGSTDKSLEIASRYPVQIVHIKPENFSFGRSLNLGIEASTGDILVAVSAHCYPQKEDWLAQLVKPFSNTEVQISFGRQLGAEATQFSEHQIFNKWFPRHSHFMKIPFCNNANSAIRRSLWEKRKYDEALSGLEDIDLAKFVLSEKGKIFYSAEAAVFHLHEETNKQVYRRYFREALAYRGIFPNGRFGFFDFLRFWIMNIVGDSLQAFKQRKLFSLFYSIIKFRFLQFWSTYRAYQMHEQISKDLQRKLYYPQKPQLFGGTD